MDFLNDLPLATLTFLAGIVIVVVACIRNDISVEEGLKLIGYVGVGAGVVGHARNGAGRGMRK